ncbi:GT-D fold domain-containing glycosyltransferase [Cohnella hongkongensis]|uniref:GT-D fold domain-containing glycosyltransferase n=1 Tax=Cohnella hongkongensis TaxID=178337 RepID=A0ABV9F7F5_9BACL
MIQSSLRKPVKQTAKPKSAKSAAPAKPAKSVPRRARKPGRGAGKPASRKRRIARKRSLSAGLPAGLPADRPANLPVSQTDHPQPEQRDVGRDEAVRQRPSDRSYEQGFQEGLIEGGERMLQEHLPADMIIPDITAREAIAAGVEALKSRAVPLLDSTAVYEELEAALREKRSYAFIRLGDGELLTLAQEKVLSLEEIRRSGAFLPYAGVTIPNLKARDELAECVQAATLIGVPMSRHPHFQPLLFAVLRAHGIDYRKLRLTTSTMNYSLEEQGLLLRLFQGRKLLIIGDVAEKLRQALINKGLEVAGVVTPVNGYADVTRIVAEAMRYDYDIALVAAGIPAIPIAVHLAGMSGKVTFDFGHLADRMAGLARPAQDDSSRR